MIKPKARETKEKRKIENEGRVEVNESAVQ